MTPRADSSATSENFEFAALSAANRYRAALLEEFQPYLRGTVLEVGAGHGQFTRVLKTVRGIVKVVAIEPEQTFHDALGREVPDCNLVRGTIDSVPPALKADAIVCVNVLEHIRDDMAELLKFRSRLVSSGGFLCLFVPARPELYAPIDRDFGHFRRYTRPELKAKLADAGFRIQRLCYFNCAGYFAWWFNFRLLKKRQFDPRAVRFFDSVIFPVVHTIERRIVRPPFGQSLLAVARPAEK